MERIFFVGAWKPSIGTHKWISWGEPGRAIVIAKSEEEAKKKLKPFLPPEDPLTKEALLKQDGRTEYYDIKIREVVGKNGVFILNDAW